MEELAKNSTATIVREEEGGGTWVSVVWCVVVGSFGSVVLGSVVLGSVAPPLSCCLERAPAAQEVPTSPPIMIILWKKILMMSDQKC